MQTPGCWPMPQLRLLAPPAALSSTAPVHLYWLCCCCCPCCHGLLCAGSGVVQGTGCLSATVFLDVHAQPEDSGSVVYLGLCAAVHVCCAPSAGRCKGNGRPAGTRTQGAMGRLEGRWPGIQCLHGTDGAIATMQRPAVHCKDASFRAGAMELQLKCLSLQRVSEGFNTAHCKYLYVVCMQQR